MSARLLKSLPIAAVLAAAAFALPAQAHGVSWSIGINAPIAPGVAVGTVIGGGHGPRVYAAAAPVWVAPAPVYEPAPVVYAPPPVYEEPVYEAPVVYGPPVVVAPRPYYRAYYRPPVIVRPGYGYHRDGDDHRRDWDGHRDGDGHRGIYQPTAQAHSDRYVR